MPPPVISNADCPAIDRSRQRPPAIDSNRQQSTAIDETPALPFVQPGTDLAGRLPAIDPVLGRATHGAAFRDIASAVITEIRPVGLLPIGVHEPIVARFRRSMIVRFPRPALFHSPERVD
jgi:hypothetical protein